ncbi:MAG: hypothetical protein HXY52_07235 [Nitrospirae bacterium]|jgi:hypothetical protein|nr:hypothetical protein [Nitrospirota bacterium]
MLNKQKLAERDERKRCELDTELLSAKYPDIESIVIIMDYYQKGYKHLMMKRTVNFSPESHAYFLMECMKHDCLEGGFNLTPVISSMVRKNITSEKGELTCQGNNSSEHAHIVFNISIKYNKNIS